MPERTDEWLLTHFELFDPDEWRKHLPQRPFPHGPLLELLLWCASGDADARLVERAVAFGERAVTTDRFLLGLHAGGALLTYHIWMVGLLRRLGADTARLPLRQCRRHIEAGVRPSLSGVGGLEFGYACELAELCSALPESIEELYARWRTGQQLHVLQMDNVDCYALTHAVFYASRFGAVRIDADDDLVSLSYLLAAERIHSGDHDLGAELLHAALILEPGSRSGEYWQRLREARRPDGYLPGPMHQPEVARSINDPEKGRAYEFGTGYHTTLVAQHALAAWKRSSACSSASVSAPIAEPSAGEIEIVQAARSRDLDALAQRVIDATDTADGRPALWHAAVRFIAAQQRPHGGFGPPNVTNAQTARRCDRAVALSGSGNPDVSARPADHQT